MTSTGKESSISFICGDITKQASECIVNPTNRHLASKSVNSVDGSIRMAAGPGLAEECSKVRGFHKGQALLTGGYMLPARYIIHVISPKERENDAMRHLKDCYMSVLEKAKEEEIHQIVFPAIGLGANGFYASDSARCAAEALKEWLRNNTGFPVEVIFCLFNEDVKKSFESAFEKAGPFQQEVPVASEEKREEDKLSEVPEGFTDFEVQDRPSAYNGNGKYIFISYSHENQEEVYGIIRQLQKDGYNVWYDEGIPGGKDYIQEIAEKIEGCSLFLAMITGKYIDSPFCGLELSYVKDKKYRKCLIYLEKTELPSKHKFLFDNIQALEKSKHGLNIYKKICGIDGINECRDQPEPFTPTLIMRPEQGKIHSDTDVGKDCDYEQNYT